jgi:hypothetical protein
MGQHARISIVFVTLTTALYGCNSSADLGNAECSLENHCHLEDGVPTCDDGYRWEDEDYPTNLTCVPIRENPCIAETDGVFCARHGFDCGSQTAT